MTANRLWTLHLLIGALRGQERYEEAVAPALKAGKLADRAARQCVLCSRPAGPRGAKLCLRSRGVVGPSPDQCAYARRSLDDSVAGMSGRAGVSVGALLEYSPQVAEQGSLDQALDRFRTNKTPKCVWRPKSGCRDLKQFSVRSVRPSSGVESSTLDRLHEGYLGLIRSALCLMEGRVTRGP